jgi:adenylate cyclase class 2
MPFEVEQKFRVHDGDALAKRLNELGARDAGAIEQLDHYFNHPSRDFAQTDEALRLRHVGCVKPVGRVEAAETHQSKNFITYKGPKLDATTKTRRELELPLPPGDELLKHYAELLTGLGFRPVAQVHKSRRQFQLNWQGRDIEIALDDVTGLGNFIELELSANEGTLEAAKSAIAALAAKLSLTENERRSYLELLLADRCGAAAHSSHARNSTEPK